MSQSTSERCTGRVVVDTETFDFQRWDVYRVAAEFQAMVPRLMSRRGNTWLRDQLNRASGSIMFNIAEGAGRFGRAEKAQFYRIARGSTAECVAALDVALARGLIGEAAHRQARCLLARVSQMLTKLILRMQ